MQAVFHPVFYQVWFQAGLPFFTRFDGCKLFRNFTLAAQSEPGFKTISKLRQFQSGPGFKCRQFFTWFLPGFYPIWFQAGLPFFTLFDIYKLFRSCVKIFKAVFGINESKLSFRDITWYSRLRYQLFPGLIFANLFDVAFKFLKLRKFLSGPGFFLPGLISSWTTISYPVWYLQFISKFQSCSSVWTWF